MNHLHGASIHLLVASMSIEDQLNTLITYNFFRITVRPLNQYRRDKRKNAYV